MTRGLSLALTLVVLLTGFVVVWPPPVAPVPAQVGLTGAANAAVRSGELPAVLELDDRMGTALVARLAEPGSVSGPLLAGGYRAGDIAFRAAEQAVVVFLVDGAALPDDGLTYLGRVTEGLSGLAGCSHDCVVRLAADAHDQ